MTQDEFGERMGVSRDVVNNIERGRVNIGEDRIRLICSVFPINENWLRTEEGEPTKDTDVEFAELCFRIGVKDEKTKKVIEEYLKLNERDKELFRNFLERLSKKE